MTRLCRLFAVTRAGFYAWRRRPVSARQRQDWALLEEMRAIFAASGGTYGSPRIQHALLASAHRVSRRRVARLMRQDGPALASSACIEARPACIGGSADSRITWDARRRPAPIRSRWAT